MQTINLRQRHGGVVDDLLRKFVEKKTSCVVELDIK